MNITRPENSANKTSGPAPSPSADRTLSETLTPGQEVRGDVLARLAERLYLVRIAGEIHTMEIPIPLEPGSTLQLTFRCSQPRPTFSLQNSSNDLVSVKLSAAAAWLTRSVSSGDPGGPKGAQILQSAPLLDSQSANPLTIAASLRNALTFSGIFYEAHLLQWFLGEIPFADILREVRSGRQRQVQRGEESGETDILPQDLPFCPDDTAGGSAATVLSEAEGTDGTAGFSTKASLPFVREQLELLLSGTFTWRGEVMPGHEMEWVVEREPEGPDAENNPAWRTSIRIRLPNLGHIRATMSFKSDGIEGIVLAEQSGTAVMLEKEIGLLQERLGETGIRLNGLVIECGE